MTFKEFNLCPPHGGTGRHDGEHTNLAAIKKLNERRRKIKKINGGGRGKK